MVPLFAEGAVCWVVGGSNHPELFQISSWFLCVV